MFDLNCVQYNNDINNKDYAAEMNTYPNVLTPPSSNEDSPQPYNLGSPQYYIQSTSPTNMIATKLYTTSIGQHYIVGVNYPNADCKLPFLTITEQPTDKFRFRYKSEMAGTHGSLTGYNSDKTRKQTYPSVKLFNFHGNGVVRCSLYQCTNSVERQPHAHRLIKKNGTEEIDDPHDIFVNQQEGYDACFHSMGIIHTAKKHIVGELVRKKKLLKMEEIALRENQNRPLTRMEDSEIKRIAEEESKSINLNIVCLRFDAFEKLPNGILKPICPPVYSHSINNLKSALTGELKIVRMDHASSPAKGNLEVYMLVEKVTKKNIKIRFFELNEDDTEIWSAFGSFTDLDVHHQYAIVFKTPPYKDLDIDSRKKVFIELLRPSDGSRSDPLQFTYYPSNNSKVGSKRARIDYFSSGSYNSINSMEIPLTISEIQKGGLSDDLQKAVKNINSDEFDKLFVDLHTNFFGESVFSHSDYGQDAPKLNVKNTERQENLKIRYNNDVENVTEEDRKIAKRVYDELNSFIKSNPPTKDLIEMLKHLFQNYKNSNGDNGLHIAIMGNNLGIFSFIVQTINDTRQNDLLTLTNNNKETLLHVALQFKNIPAIKLLLDNVYDLSHQDENGNTVLHIAVEVSFPKVILDMVVKHGLRHKMNINAENNAGLTALHLAVRQQNLTFVELLCKNGAYVNSVDRKTGRSILHEAIEKKSLEIVSFLLDITKINVQMEDHSGMSPLTMAKHLQDEDPRTVKIFELIQDYMKSRGLFDQCMIKDEAPDSDEEMEIDMEIKSEKLTTEELDKEYEGVQNFAPIYLDRLSEILDASGNWESLADLLDLGHLVDTDLIVKAKSPSKAILNSAVTLSTVLEIRNFLEYLGEDKAVRLIDEMVMSNKQ